MQLLLITFYINNIKSNNYVAIFNGEIYNYKQQYNYTCIVNNIKTCKLYKV